MPCSVEDTGACLVHGESILAQRCAVKDTESMPAKVLPVGFGQTRGVQEPPPKGASQAFVLGYPGIVSGAITTEPGTKAGMKWLEGLGWASLSSDACLAGDAGLRPPTPTEVTGMNLGFRVHGLGLEVWF